MLCTFLGIRRPVRFPPPPLPPPPTNMGWCDERDCVSPPNLTSQQHQQQGPSPRVTQALELYRVCVAAGQCVRFSVEQRAEGEFISLSSKPPAAAAIAAAVSKKQKKKQNKRRVELRRKWQENHSSSTAAAARAQQQPPPAGGQQQQQATTSYSSILKKLPTPSSSAASRPLATQQTTRTAAAAAVGSTMETRSSKKRKVALSPGGATVAGPASPSMPMPIGSGIPQTDGAEETPMTPPVHTEGDRLIGVDTTTVQRYQPAPVPPPMTRLSRHPLRVLCRFCSMKTHNISYAQCEFCHLGC